MEVLGDAPEADGGAPAAARAPRRTPPALLLGLVGVLVVIVVTSRPAAPEPPPAEPPLAAVLQVAGEVSTSQSGVLVVPVDVVNDGPDLRIVRSQVWAEPVRSDPATGGVTRVAAGRTGRVVALVEPDCRLLGPQSPLRFVASLGVRMAVGDGRERDVYVDLGAQPFLAQHVTTLCRATHGGVGRPSPGVGSVAAGMVFVPATNS